MNLSSIVVSRDFRGISILESVLSSLHIQVEVEPELSGVRKKLARSKVDALIVDSEIEGFGNLLQEIDKPTMDGLVSLLICDGSKRAFVNPRTEFLFRKPISVTQAVHTLSSARNRIVDRRLRYHRQNVDIAASLISGERTFDTRIMNLSQGGAGLEGNFANDIQQRVQLNFSLPRTGHSVELEGDVVWMKQQARAGVQFKSVSESIQKRLQIWLEQHFFSRDGR